MSLKMPPPPFTYSKGGGAGSLEHNLTVMTSPTSPLTIDLFTLAKFGSKRLWRAVINLMPALSQMRMASMVSGRSVAIGFSQKTSLPAAAHFVICSAWKEEGEQIQTAWTSGWLMTSSESADHSGTKYCLAAASALLTVGFEMMTHSASWVWDLRCCVVCCVVCGVVMEASRVYSLALDIICSTAWPRAPP